MSNSGSLFKPTLREVLERATPATPLVLAGVGSPLEALAAQRAGFAAVYVSGYAVAAWRHGLPDIGLIAAGEMADASRAVTRVVTVPTVVDIDTGYGDVAGVTSTVRLLESAGAGGVQLEDQSWPKRCGHMRGKDVVDVEVHVRRIAAAVAARRDPATVVIARTDAVAVHGIDDALVRAHRYHEAGADVLFVDAPEDVDQLERIGRELPGPLMVNISEGGRTPQMSAAELGKLGFSVVIFPTSALRIASRAISEFYTDLHRTGDSRGWLDRMHMLDDLNELVGLRSYEALDVRALSGEAR
jgi:2-methylisocitrate lyase-like PEP mutase family enzyme